MFALQILTIDVIRYWSLFCVPLAILLFVLPCRMRIRHQARWMMVLLACGMKGIVYEQFGGDAMAPNLPEGLVWFWNWADDGMFFLVLLSLVWWVRKGRVWILPVLAWGIAAWGQYNGTAVPSVKEVELRFEDLPASLDDARTSTRFSSAHSLTVCFFGGLNMRTVSVHSSCRCRFICLPLRSFPK